MFHDLGRVRARLDALTAAFPRGTLHAVAVKANPLVEVLKVVVAHGAGLEAASFEELELALAAGCPPERLVYDSPARTVAELRDALALGAWVNVDGPEELERIAVLGPPQGARIGLRVNPGVGAGSIAATSTVARGGRFGVSVEDVPALVARHPFVTGLHVHTGSQGVGLALIEAAVRVTAELARSLGLAWLDVGGGIPVRYTAADPEPPTYAAWGAMVADAAPGFALVTEAGRSVHAAAGFTVTRVESVKRVGDRTLAIVHVGADLFLRWVYASASWDHDLALLDADGRVRVGPGEPVDVAGPLCFAGDVPARGRTLPAPRAGDLLLVRDTGAYTLSMWSRHCSRALPPVWGVDGDAFVRLHAGETPADVVRFWSNRPAEE
ncbi:MAG: diaminopimelate decarboxylase [Alphaproteobacteria bacterium]|nr:diaminopimelate decarboxylase [Alphaproteobacteria bacterium]